MAEHVRIPPFLKEAQSAYPGPILESKGTHVILQQKDKSSANIENLGKNVQNLKIFWKGAASCVWLFMHETARICPATLPVFISKAWYLPHWNFKDW